MPDYKTVTLPNGENVDILVGAPDESWFVHGKTGYLDPKMLAPYYRQPRRYIDPAKLAELQANIAHNGVREAVLITPRHLAPWAEEGPEYEGTFWRIVSGHRRQKSSVKADLPAVPVIVRVYATEAAFKADAEILNDHRENLSEIEEGYILLDRLERGEKITHIVAESGKSYQHLMGRVALTKLSPEIQALLSPELTSRARLAIGFASALGDLKALPVEELETKLVELGDRETDPEFLNEDERRFCLQIAYLKYVQRQNWGGVIGEKFVRTGERPEKQLINGGLERVRTHEKKLSVRDQLIAWCKGISNTQFMDMPPAEMRRAFEYAIREDMEAIVAMLRQSSKDTQAMADMLEKIAQSKPKTSREVLERSHRREQEVIIAK